MTVIECPYCEKDTGIYYGDVIRNNEMSGELECPICGNTFEWELDYEIITHKVPNADSVR
jgi:transcription elongation factor Elf1